MKQAQSRCTAYKKKKKLEFTASELKKAQKGGKKSIYSGNCQEKAGEGAQVKRPPWNPGLTLTRTLTLTLTLALNLALTLTLTLDRTLTITLKSRP